MFFACALVVLLSPLRYLRKLKSSKMINSLWAGTPIINMANNAKAERLLGINARSLVYTTYFITDAFDYNLSKWSAVPVLGRLIPLGVFMWACLWFDRLHFYCDRGLLPSRGLFTFDFRELYIYRILGIPVFLWTYGADIRSQKVSQSMGEPNCCTDCDNPGKYCICDDTKAKGNLNKLVTLSRATFAGVGDMFDYTPGSINDTYFWPIDLEADGGKKYRPAYPRPSKDRALRIVHASNHRMFKGTRYLIKATEALRTEGLEVELVLVEKVPNREALEIYRSADLIFDQCLMGNYGYFALEGMALGKPVMCYIRKPDEYLLHPEECPIINTHVRTLKDDIRRLVEKQDKLTETGIQGRKYIEKYFTIEAFAERLGRAYKDLGVVA